MKAKLYDGKTFFLSCWEVNMELTYFLEAKDKFEFSCKSWMIRTTHCLDEFHDILQQHFILMAYGFVIFDK